MLIMNKLYDLNINSVRINFKNIYCGRENLGKFLFVVEFGVFKRFFFLWLFCFNDLDFLFIMF